MANSLSHAALPYPIKNARFTLPLSFRVSAGTPTDPTTPDTEFSTDGGASFADCAEEITTGGSNGVGYLTLTGAETNANVVAIAGKSANCVLTPAILYPRVLASVGTGTLSAGSAGGGTLGTLLPYDVTGCYIQTTGGTGGGGTGGANNQARKIITYVPSTGVFTVSPNWETTPDATTTYSILLPEGVTLGMLRTLNPTTAGNTLDVTATGEAGIDWANIGGKTTTNALTGTTIAVTQKVDVDTIKTNPVVNGGTITFPTNATLASTTNITAGTITTVTTTTTVTNGVTISVGTGTGQLQIASGVVDANMQKITGSNAATLLKFTGSIGTGTVSGSPTTTSVPSSNLSPAGNVVDEFKGRYIIFDGATTTPELRGQSALITGSSLANVLTVKALTTAPVVGDVFTVQGGQVQADVVGDKTGYVLTQTFPTNFSSLAITAGGIVQADLQTIKTQTVTCSGGVTIPAATLASTTNITAGTLTTVTTATNVTTVNGLAAGVITATSIAADAITAAKIADGAIDAATFTAGAINAAAIATDAITAGKIAADAIGASELATDAVAEIAAAIWDLATSGHTTSGTFGAAAVAAGGAGDPWSTLLPGSYGVGTAGYIVGTNIDGTITSRAAAATALSTTQWTNTRAGYLDNLSGGAVALAATALSNVQWTNTLATNIATTNSTVATNLNATVSSRAAAATALSTADWTNTRAGYLDNLSAGAVALAGSAPSWYTAPVDVSANVSAIKAKTDNLPTDPADASDIVTAFGIVNDTLATLPTAVQVADTVLSRSVSNVETSAAEHSLCTIILAGLESIISGTTWTIHRTDGTTTYLTKTVTTDNTASPIVAVT